MLAQCTNRFKQSIYSASMHVPRDKYKAEIPVITGPFVQREWRVKNMTRALHDGRLAVGIHNAFDPQKVFAAQ